jgi:hypothetical protein
MASHRWQAMACRERRRRRPPSWNLDVIFPTWEVAGHHGNLVQPTLTISSRSDQWLHFYSVSYIVGVRLHGNVYRRAAVQCSASFWAKCDIVTPPTEKWAFCRTFSRAPPPGGGETRDILLANYKGPPMPFHYLYNWLLPLARFRKSRPGKNIEEKKRESIH